jgi:hypothetical protein
MKTREATDAEMLEIREALLEGMAVELIPMDEGGWYGRIGILRHCVYGNTAAEVFLRLADILVGPDEPAVQ